MKKLKPLNRTDMKKVIGAIRPESYCSEAEVYAHCDIKISAIGPGGSYDSFGSFEGCMERGQYEAAAQNPNNRCRILGEGGPHPVAPVE